MAGIKVPININLKGKYRIKRIDTRNNKVDLDTGYKDNMLLDNYLDALFNSTEPGVLLHNTWATSDVYDRGTMDHCKIGSGTTAPTRSDTSLESLLATEDEANNISRSDEGVNEIPVYVKREYLFKAGTGTGNVNEIGLYSNTVGIVARQVLDSTITKEDYHELYIYWKQELSVNSQPFSGTITGGQRDGVTDINWTAVINDDQLYHGFTKKYQYASGDFAQSTLQGLFSGGLTPYLFIGDSNTSSDISSDNYNTLKGSELFSGTTSLNTIYDYTLGSYQRKIRVGLEKTQANGQIGEVILTGYSSWTGSPCGAIARFTFDPKLDKIDSYRLYLDFIISLNAS